jgi:hypothetical protein
MALAAVALVSTSAWAVWNPDTDSYQLFNMDFETYDNAAHTATDANASIVGTVIDYNTTYPNLFGEETGKAGLVHDANFAEIHDESPGKGIPEGNDAKLTVLPTSGRFDLGWPADKRTWTFWFNVPNLGGTIIRHAYHDITDEDFKDKWWEIRIVGHKLQFHHQNNSLRMETASPLNELGVDANTWHHAAVVIDRTDSEETIVPTTQLSTKIYIDGLEAPVIVTSLNTASMRVDYSSADLLWIGAGEREFDGLLDDVRLFKRVLDPLQVSILNQPDNTIPIAFFPIPRSSNVAIATDVNWEPAPGATLQKVYFGTDPCDLQLAKTFNNGTSNKVLNADLNDACDIIRDTRYYWYVKSTIDSVDSNGPLWSFTTETGRALNPSPYDGEEDVDVNDVNLSWTTTTSGTYSVYLSKNWSEVNEACSTDPNVWIANGISEHNVIDVNTSSRGAIYYWRVNTTYTSPPASIPGDIWSFRTKPYELVFNTSGAQIIYKDHPVEANYCVVHGNGWSDPCAIGSLASCGVAEFNFPSGFNYDKRYDIIVIPQYGATDVNDIVFPTPLAIHVTGDFSFDGRVQIAGDDILTTGQDETFARSGGFGGPKHNQDISIFPNADEHPANFSDYWTSYPVPQGAHRRLNNGITSPKTLWVPTDLARSVFGPGQPVNPPYKGGGGGGSGGAGGESGRGWELSIFNSAGPSYGDEEVPIPFGGSSGGWGGDDSPGGAAGGGGIEIVATGNVIFDINSQINANGGSQLCSPTKYPGGGGGGGSVKIIAAGGSVTLKGSINVNGGKGGDNTLSKSNDTGGGGGGGRVAVFYGTTYSNTGDITAEGGDRGMNYSTNPPTSLAQNGKSGTIFVTQRGPNDLAKKASTPTPANGAMVYCNPDPCTITLKWYSGYGGSTDVVYLGTNTNPADPCGTVSATRGQHDVNVTVSSGKTYYWKVVTDTNVSSDIWFFKTTNWQCLQYTGTEPYHVSGPEWDSNRDCVLNLDDFWFFAKDWQNPVYNPAMGLDALSRFAGEWMDCFNRTDNGCDNW